MMTEQNLKTPDSIATRQHKVILPVCHVLSVFVGRTKTLVDSRGEWRLSIARDREALELYIRYKKTEDGIRVINHRKVYLFRRMVVYQAPAVPGLGPIP